MALSAVALVLCLLLVSCVAVTTSNIPWWNIKLAQEQGPNVCVVEEIPGTKHRIWTECKYWNSREVCNIKPLLRYECCEGFKQVAGTQGCIGVTPLKNLLETARQLGAGKFVKYLEQSGLAPELDTEGPFTLFAPSDEVFREIPKDKKNKLDSGSPNYLRPILHYHIAEGRITSAQFKADLLVPTRYSGHPLRINKYSSRIETVNCALLQRKDQEANNGVVHIINGLLDPSYTVERDLAELIVHDGRFQELSKAMDKSGLVAKLKSTNQPFTVLAPSDEAFSKLKPSRLTKILNDKQALQELLENHLLPNVVCPPAIIGEHKVSAVGAKKVTFDCDRRGVRAGNNHLHSDFTLGLNGVIYLVDNIIIPDRAKTLLQLLEEEKLSTFLQLIKFAGLEDAFENFGEYTLFVPSEDAMISLPSRTLQQLKTNREMARHFVLFHATQGRIKTDNMKNNEVLISLNEQKPLRIQLYRAGVTANVGPRVVAAVEGASVQEPDHECLNGVIHIINKALFPANLTAEEHLRQNGSYKLFLKALEKVSSERSKSLDLLKSKTYFVPNDDAFRRMGETRLNRMMSDTVYLNKTVRNHICDNMLMTEFIQPDLQYSVPSYLNTLSITQDDGNIIRVNDVEIVDNDILTSSGVIHTINKVLLPDQNIDG